MSVEQSDNTILQVLICTCGADGLRRIAAMDHPEVAGVEYIISLQRAPSTEENSPLSSPLSSPFSSPFFSRKDVKVAATSSIGLCANRNHALSLATAPYALIADDDLNYTRKGLQEAMAAFKQHPDCSILTFRYSSTEYPREYPDKEFDLNHPPKGYFATSFEIGLNLDKIRSIDGGAYLRFDENFGIGAHFGSGEEDILLHSLLKAGHKGRFLPITITEHPGATTSMRRRRNSRFVETSGAVVSYLHPATSSLRMLTHAKRALSDGWKPIPYCKHWITGQREFLRIRKADRRYKVPTWPPRNIPLFALSSPCVEEGLQIENTPFFTVIMPLYNEEKYIRESIGSLLAQTFSDWQLIIADDGSTDSSPSICREYAERYPGKIHLLTLRENTGSDFIPRITAMRKAAGRYLVQLDADDLLPGNYLHDLHQRISDTEAEIVYAPMLRLKPDGSTEHFLPDPAVPDRILNGVSTGREILKYTLGKWMISSIGATERTLALKSMEVFDNELRQPSAFSIFDNENLSRLDLLLAKRVAFIDTPYLYRIDLLHTEKREQPPSPRTAELMTVMAAMQTFVGKHLGTDSEEYALCHEMLFYNIWDHLKRSMRFTHLKTDPHARICLDIGMKTLDRKVIWHRVSKKYQFLLLLPARIRELAIRLLGKY